jgi:hypothetical protein
MALRPDMGFDCRSGASNANLSLYQEAKPHLRNPFERYLTWSLNHHPWKFCIVTHRTALSNTLRSVSRVLAKPTTLDYVRFNDCATDDSRDRALLDLLRMHRDIRRKIIGQGLAGC